ncbi:uncharacterized protein Z518_00989 [Rhinocladiella mackenziei CBS 650.93]|uniref:NAD(P)-binding domain-containing protein n=1 Tax=Rhinocladiella mackenziei CBS 650.93 TaxID=1442369 RepID=A0A0D2HGW0_9EURO|nr:uncharacterized protein Z518_00989 [Rhinocladiella mackenziei CBS 650.93]KIX09908.1 hypothetical protein Z518_00989 [Rhinocladiella mackenziei CBS 650.93]
MKYDSVIIFGPTGGVGGGAALEAHARGAKVWLAMRDTSKPIAGLTPEQEEKGRYTRAQADLSDPASVANAVKQSGAKAAFTYVQRGPGVMKSTVQAMKDAGVEYVVLLSSRTVKGDLRTIEPNDFIPFYHAQAEIAIQDAGLALTAVRPGVFASNPAKKRSGQIQIAPASPPPSVLVDRPSQSQTEVIYLHGPEIMTHNTLWETIQGVTGEPIEINHITKEQYLELAKGKVPAPVAEYLARILDQGDISDRFPEELYAVASKNVKTYTGRDPTSFAEYVAKHKEDFAPAK